RNFANKIWNASRFILMNLKGDVRVDLCQYFADPGMNLADKWILSRFYRMLQKVDKALESYRFNEAAGEFYAFFWGEFCDWYLELSKPKITERHTQVTLYKTLEKSLRVLHPFMPFITEEIWQTLTAKAKAKESGETIMRQPWPHIQKQLINPKIDRQMQTLIDIIVGIRNIRSVWNIPNSLRLSVTIKASGKDQVEGIRSNDIYVKNLARVESLDVSPDAQKPDKAAVCVVTGGIEVFVPLESVIDFDKEKARMNKEIDRLSALSENIENKLGNEGFMAKAPTQVIEKEKAKKAELDSKISALKANLG
ncbi:MAG: class I tRNA ligase family protein, partial [Candidatus Omnitrophota bacterium]